MPTPLPIGAAIMNVLKTPKAPGVLKDVLPWWGTFLTDSTNYKLPRQLGRESAVGNVLAAGMCADANTARLGEGRVEEGNRCTAMSFVIWECVWPRLKQRRQLRLE